MRALNFAKLIISTVLEDVVLELCYFSIKLSETRFIFFLLSLHLVFSYVYLYVDCVSALLGYQELENKTALLS